MGILYALFSPATIGGDDIFLLLDWSRRRHRRWPTARGYKNYVSGMYWWPYPAGPAGPTYHISGRHPFWTVPRTVGSLIYTNGPVCDQSNQPGDDTRMSAVRPREAANVRRPNAGRVRANGRPSHVCSGATYRASAARSAAPNDPFANGRLREEPSTGRLRDSTDDHRNDSDTASRHHPIEWRARCDECTLYIVRIFVPISRRLSCQNIISLFYLLVSQRRVYSFCFSF